MIRSHFLHSFIGHPMMALLHLIGLEQAGNWVHDKLFPVADRGQDPDLPPLVFTYTNWRGETSQRQVQPIELFHGATKWHPDPQWLLQAFDLDKGQERAFTVNDMVFCSGLGEVEAIAREMASEMVRAREALNNFVRESPDPGADAMSSVWVMGQLLNKAQAAGLLSEGRSVIEHTSAPAIPDAITEVTESAARYTKRVGTDFIGRINEAVDAIDGCLDEGQEIPAAMLEEYRSAVSDLAALALAQTIMADEQLAALGATEREG